MSPQELKSINSYMDEFYNELSELYEALVDKEKDEAKVILASITLKCKLLSSSLDDKPTMRKNA
jgi:hypothetical protein